MRSFVKQYPHKMAKTLCPLLGRQIMAKSRFLVAINAIRENKILAKISEFTVFVFLWYKAVSYFSIILYSSYSL